MQNDTNADKPYSINQKDVIALFGSPSLFRECVNAGWLSPVFKNRKLTLFDRQEVAEAWERLKGGDRPLNRKESAK